MSHSRTTLRRPSGTVPSVVVQLVPLPGREVWPRVICRVEEVQLVVQMLKAQSQVFHRQLAVTILAVRIRHLAELDTTGGVGILIQQRAGSVEHHTFCDLGPRRPLRAVRLGSVILAVLPVTHSLVLSKGRASRRDKPSGKLLIQEVGYTKPEGRITP